MNKSLNTENAQKSRTWRNRNLALRLGKCSCQPSLDLQVPGRVWLGFRVLRIFSAKPQKVEAPKPPKPWGFEGLALG